MSHHEITVAAVVDRFVLAVCWPSRMGANAEYIAATTRVEAWHSKSQQLDNRAAEDAVALFLRAYEQVTGNSLLERSRVLDFGCGIGSACHVLVEQGFDAYGLDIIEYWGRDVDLWGCIPTLPPQNVISRLKTYDHTTNKLPFDDSTFDLIISDQVLEHVFDLRPIFREHIRVLKPGAIAIHHFPKSCALIEGHTKLPFTPLNRYRAYLVICALLGMRNERQKGMSWRGALASNEQLFATTHYVPAKRILRMASECGAVAKFADILSISLGQAAKLHRKIASIGLGAISGTVLSRLSMCHLLVMRKPY